MNLAPLRRILLIGDSCRFVRTLSSEPALHGVSFEHTAGAADTLRRVRALPCDLVITDRSTPIAEDLALVEELRLLRPGVPVVVVAPDATTQTRAIVQTRATDRPCLRRSPPPGLGEGAPAFGRSGEGASAQSPLTCVSKKATDRARAVEMELARLWSSPS